MATLISLGGRTLRIDGPLSEGRAGAIAHAAHEAGTASLVATRERMALNGDRAVHAFEPGPGRFADMERGLEAEGYAFAGAFLGSAAAAVAGVALAAAFYWQALSGGVSPPLGFACCAGFLAPALGFAWYWRRLLRMPAHATLTGIGRRAVDAASQVLTVGEGRVYVAARGADGRTEVREIRYDALGSAHLRHGRLTLYDRAGLPLAEVVDPVATQGVDAVEAARYLRERARR